MASNSSQLSIINQVILGLSGHFIICVLLYELYYMVFLHLCLIMNDYSIYRVCVWITLHLFLGLLPSYTIHELGHVVLLQRTMRCLTCVVVSSSVFSFSITPHGSTTGRGIFLSSLAGPLLTASIGIVLFVTVPFFQIHLWYFLHVLFILPVFSDGRSMVFGLLRWNSFVHLPNTYEQPKPDDFQ